MAKSRGRKFAELVAPTNGVFAAASIPTLAISKLASSAVTINSESVSLGGSLTLDTSDIGEHTSNKYFTDTRAQATLSVASNSGHGALAYDNSNGEFTFAGITTEAIQDVVGAMFSSNTETAVTVTYQDSDGTIDLIVDDTTKVPLAGGTMTGNLTLGDNVNAYFGASTDLRIYHDGTNSHIINSTGELRVTGSNIAIKSDSAKLYLGASDDLQIYHDGSNSYIKDAGTGALRIAGSQVILRNAADSAHMLRADDGGAVGLYHNSSSKLETTSTGVAITGLATMTTGTASSKFAVGTATVHGSYDFYNDGTSYFNGAVTVDDTLSANNVSILGTGILRVGTNQTWSVAVNPSSSIRLAYDGVERSITGHYTDGMSIRTNAHILRLATDGKVHFPAFTFPASDGSANQILQTNGSGTVSWVTNSGGSSLWTQSGSDIYYSSGEVGIGTSNPGAPLHVNASNNVKVLLSGSNDPLIRWQEGTTNKAYMQWVASGYILTKNEETTANFTLGDAFKLYPTTDEAFLIERGGSALRQHIKNVSTTGTYSYLQLTTTNSSSAVDSGYLLKNAAQNTGNSLANNSLYLWNTSERIEFVPSGTIGKRTTVDTNGDLTIRGAGATASTGIVGEAYTGYFGLRQGDQTKDSEYMIATKPSDHTYISANSGYNVIIRNSANNSTNQLIVGSGATGLSWRANTVWTAENDGSGSGLDADTLDGVQSSAFLRSDANDTTTGLLTVENDIYLGSSGSRRHLKISSSSFPEVRFFRGTTERYRIGTADANTSYGNQAEGDFYLYSAQHNVMRLKVPIAGGEITRNNDSIVIMDTSSNYQRKAGGIQLGSTGTLTNASGTLALAASNPYISFHHGSGARTAYFQEASSRFYAGEVTYSETEGSYRAPIFYDVNNTSYYSDQANVTRLNNLRPDIVSTPGSGTATMFVFGKNTGSTDHINFGGSSADPANVSNTVGLSWGTRSDGNGYYLIGVHNYNNTYSTHSRLRIGWHTGLELGGHTTYGGVRIFEDSPFVNGTEQARFRGSGGIVFSRSLTDTIDIRAPIFYDSNDTSFYGNFAANNADAIRVQGNIQSEAQIRATGWHNTSAGSIGGFGFEIGVSSGIAYALAYNRNSASYGQMQFNATRFTFHGQSSGYLTCDTSVRAPIFYDTNNTGYYCDPAGTSNFSVLTTNSTTTFNSTVVQSDNQQFRQEGYFRTNTSGQNTNGSADAYSFGYQVAGAWSHPYPDLILGFHTGVRIGGHKNYHGTRFYNDHPDKGSSPSEIFSVGKSDDHVRATNNIYAYTSDKRLKENFRPIENAVDKVKALGGFIFDWRKDMMDKHSFAPDQEKDDAGLIAQEVQKVMPAAIRRAPFDYDPDKPNHSKSGEEFLTVQYEKMVPLLIEAIKEQQEQIDQLKKLLEEKE